MREAGRVSARALRLVGEAVRPGVTTEELDELAETIIREAGGVPAFKGYHGFPKTLCTSVNSQVVHGIPSSTVVLVEGDVLSVDVGAIVGGYYGDNAATFAVGAVSAEAQRLLDATAASLQAGIAQCVPGNRLFDIGHAVQTVAEGAGFSVVREYVGHGIGRNMHEDPNVPELRARRQGPEARRGHGAGDRADGQPRRRAGRVAAGRLDGRDAGRIAVGALRAHGRHHGGRPARADGGVGDGSRVASEFSLDSVVQTKLSLPLACSHPVRSSS